MTDQWHSGQGLVGRWDPEARLFTATALTYGPAGPATVEVADGVRLSVDYSNPHMTAEVVIEAPLDGDPAALGPQAERAGAALLSSGVLERLLALARDDGSPRPRRIAGDEHRYRRGLAPARRWLGRLAILVELARDGDAPALQSAVAALEAAAVAALADPDMSVLGPLASSLASGSAVELLLLEDAGLLEIDGRRAALELAAVVYAALAFIDDDLLKDRMRRLERALRAREHLNPEPVAAAGASQAPSVTRPRAERPHVGPSVPADGAPAVTAILRSATEVDVRVATGHPGCWARVFRRRDLLVLAVAPIVDLDADRGALMVVPKGHRADELFVDVTEEPHQTRPSPLLASMRSAVAMGRHACRLERLGDRETAREAWASCGDGWSSVGSPERAQTARRYADGARTEFPSARREAEWRPGQPLAADFFGPPRR